MKTYKRMVAYQHPIIIYILNLLKTSCSYLLINSSTMENAKYHCGMFLFLVAFSMPILELHAQTLEKDSFYHRINEDFKLVKKGEYQAFYEATKKTMEDATAVLGPNHPTTIETRNKHGWALFRNSKIREAEAILDSNLQARLTYDPENYYYLAKSYETLSMMKIRLNKTKEGFYLGRKAIEVYDNHIDTMPLDYAMLVGNIADNYGKQWILDTAIMLTNKCIKIYEDNQLTDDPSYGYSINNQGNNYLMRSNFTLAQSYFKKAREILIEKLGPDHPQISNVVTGLGNCALYSGKIDDALQYFEEKLRIRSKTYGPENLKVAFAYQEFVQAYLMKENYEKALEYQFQALEIVENHYPSNKSSLCDYYNTLSEIYLKKGNPSLALEYITKAEKIADEIYKPGSHPLGLTKMYKVLYAQETQQYELCLDVVDQAIHCLQQSETSENADLAEALIQQSICLQKKQQLDEALASLEAAKKAITFESTNPNAYQEIVSNVTLLKSLSEEANIYRAKYQLAKDPVWLSKADKSYKDSHDFFNYVLSSFIEGESVSSLSTIQLANIEKGILNKIELAAVSNDKTHLKEALEWVDSHKSRLSLKNLKTIDTYIDNEETATLAYELKLKKENAHYYKTEILYVDSIAAIDLRSKLLLAQEEVAAYEQIIASKNQEYYSLFINAGKQDLPTLDQNTQVLAFFEGETNWIGFRYSNNQVFASILDLDNVQINDLLADIKSQKEVSKATQNIYNSLIVPLDIDPNQTNLIVIADGDLTKLPFEIIQNPTGNYLFQDYTISYASSLQMLAFQNSQASQAKEDLLAFAPSYHSTNEKSIDYGTEQTRFELGNLPGAKAEVSKIMSLFNGQTFTDLEATESQFFNYANTAKMLHLAMHSLIDPNEPLRSKLLFTNEETNGEYDNIVYAHELYNQKIDADLVVLSACNTGVGTLKRGEGLLSLSHAFAYSGTPALVYSLWKVPDQATAVIMEAFYTFIKEGNPKDEALRKAKLAYLQNDAIPASQKTPYHWAGFIASGNMSPISFAAFNNRLLICGIILLALGFIGFIWLRRKN